VQRSIYVAIAMPVIKSNIHVIMMARNKDNNMIYLIVIYFIDVMIMKKIEINNCC
jgi:hypothetical protein